MMSSFRRKVLFFLSLLIINTQAFSLAKIGFIDIFPVFRIGSRNFVGESIDRLYYNQYLAQPKVLTAGIDYEIVGLHFYLAADFFKNLEADSTNFAYSNIPVTKRVFSGSINNNWPTAGFLAYKNDFITVSVGRRKWGLGYGDYSLIAGVDQPYYDGLWFGVHPKVGKGRLFYYFLLASDDRKAIKSYWKDDVYVDDGTGNMVLDKAYYFSDYESKSKWFVAHKIGYQWEKFRLGITEAAVIYGAPLSFFNANPFMFWHNTYDDGLNVSLGLSGEGLINEDMRLYGEALLDDFRLGTENKDTNPIAIGFTLGFDWQVFNLDEENTFLGPNFDPNRTAIREQSFAFDRPGLKLSFQAAYASTYLYGRSEKDPLGKFAFFNYLQLGVGHWTGMENYLGLPQGPDTVLVEVAAHYQQKRWKVDSSIGFLVQGQKGAAATGYYPFYKGYKESQGLFNSEKTADWALSHVENYMLLLNMKGYYAINTHFNAYAGLNSRLILNHFTMSRFSFETGVGMRF